MFGGSGNKDVVAKVQAATKRVPTNAPYIAYVSGPTMACGREIVKQLLGSDRCLRVYALVQNKKNFNVLKHFKDVDVGKCMGKLELVEVDFAKIEDAKYRKGFSIPKSAMQYAGDVEAIGFNALCATGYGEKVQRGTEKTDYAYSIGFAKLAMEQFKVTTLSLVSGAGARMHGTIDNMLVNANLKNRDYFALMRKREIGFESLKCKNTIIARPGELKMNPAFEPASWKSMVGLQGAVIDARQVAKGIVMATESTLAHDRLLSEEEAEKRARLAVKQKGNKVLFVNSFEEDMKRSNAEEEQGWLSSWFNTCMSGEAQSQFTEFLNVFDATKYGEEQKTTSAEKKPAEKKPDEKEAALKRVKQVKAPKQEEAPKPVAKKQGFCCFGPLRKRGKTSSKKEMTKTRVEEKKTMESEKRALLQNSPREVATEPQKKISASQLAQGKPQQKPPLMKIVKKAPNLVVLENADLCKLAGPTADELRMRSGEAGTPLPRGFPKH